MAFNKLKAYSTTPLIFSKPKIGEVLYLYLITSNKAISVTLVREDNEDKKACLFHKLNVA